MTKLTPAEYLPMALVTKAQSVDPIEDLRHAGCGLVTEPGEIIDQYKRHWFYKKELDLKNIREEIGDTLWYIAIGLFGLGEKFPEVWPGLNDLSEDAQAALKAAPDTTILPKMVVYSRNFFTGAFALTPNTLETNSEFLEYELICLLKYMGYLAESIGYSLEEAAWDNIIKLRKRYPDGFTQFAALNRDTVNELSHIAA